MEDSKKNIKKFLEEQDSDKIARAAKGAGAQGGEKTETTEKSEKPIDTDKEKKREELEKLKDEEKKAQEEKKRLEEKRAQDAQKLTETNIGIMTAKKKAEEKEKEKGPVRETLEEKVEQKTKKPTGKKVKTSKAGSPDQPKADLGKKGEIPQTLTSALGQYQAGRLFALGYSEWQIKRMSPYEIKRILSRRQKTSEKKPVAPVPEKVGNEKGGKESEKEKLKIDWTTEDEKTLNNLLVVVENENKTIENAKKRMTEIDAEIERVKKEEEQAVISEPEDKESKKEEVEGDKFQTNPIQNSQEKSGIPIATEVFNEKRSIKDISGKEITIGDIVTSQSNQDWLVRGFIEEKIAERYLKPGQKDFVLYAELAEYDNGEVNFNLQNNVRDGECTLKEKWQPKYGNGEIIKIGDIVKANVEKFNFEIYNKKLKVIGFNLNGFVSVEVLGGDSGRAVHPSLLERAEEQTGPENKEKTVN